MLFHLIYYEYFTSLTMLVKHDFLITTYIYSYKHSLFSQNFGCSIISFLQLSLKEFLYVSELTHSDFLSLPFKSY